MRGQVTALALIGLSACQPEAPRDPPLDIPMPTTAEVCGADKLGHLIGAPEAAIADLHLGQPVRVIHPGDAVTMDYLPGRMNFVIGADGRIEQIDCY